VLDFIPYFSFLLSTVLTDNVVIQIFKFLFILQSYKMIPVMRGAAEQGVDVRLACNVEGEHLWTMADGKID